jgi:hypothetical protein
MLDADAEIVNDAPAAEALGEPFDVDDRRFAHRGNVTSTG